MVGRPRPSPLWLCPELRMMPFAFVRPAVDPAQRPKASQNNKRDDHACMRAATIDDDQRSTLSANAMQPTARALRPLGAPYSARHVNGSPVEIPRVIATGRRSPPPVVVVPPTTTARNEVSAAPVMVLVLDRALTPPAGCCRVNTQQSSCRPGD
jgi:hypothetical protein